MVIGYTEITYGTEKLYLRNLTRKKVPGTMKQKLGGNLVKHQLPATSKVDWHLDANGIIFGDGGTAATTTRVALEALNDLEPYHYSDGLISASMIIENLSFPDSSDNPLHYEYNIKLIQYQQTD